MLERAAVQERCGFGELRANVGAVWRRLYLANPACGCPPPVNGQDALNCLYFNNYRVVHQHVESVSVIQLKVVVEDWNDLFGYYCRTCLPQFVCQTGGIDAFQQTRPQS